MGLINLSKLAEKSGDLNFIEKYFISRTIDVYSGTTLSDFDEFEMDPPRKKYQVTGLPAARVKINNLKIRNGNLVDISDPIGGKGVISHPIEVYDNVLSLTLPWMEGNGNYREEKSRKYGIDFNEYIVAPEMSFLYMVSEHGEGILRISKISGSRPPNRRRKKGKTLQERINDSLGPIAIPNPQPNY